MNAPKTNSATSRIQMQELSVLLQNTNCSELTDVLNTARKSFVQSKHPRAISQMKNAAGRKKDKWKTYVYVNGKRKEILATTEDEIYEKLYRFYYESETAAKTLQEVFDLYMPYKKDFLMCCKSTLRENQRMFSMLSSTLKNSPITSISDDDIRIWLSETFLPTHPAKGEFKKVVELLGQVFSYGIRNKYCFENPMHYLDINIYFSRCRDTKKVDEDKAFSVEELSRIEKSTLQELSNPRALMTLLAMETGLRCGELPVLRKTDVHDGYLHVHRQQRKETDDDGHQVLIELPFTKNERKNPSGGRYVPLTEKATFAITQACALSPESEYIFSDNGKVISKDSYAQNLRRRCEHLNITTTNNHAFRCAFNSRMIALGLSPADRALILGHRVETNETFYSLTDKRRLDQLKRVLTGQEAA